MKIRELVVGAMFVALIAVVTAYVKLPIATGYIHLGDTFIFLACYLLRPRWSIAVSGLGSALADVITGYFIYAPATLVIKAGMACVVALMIFKKPTLPREILALVAASALLLAGYFVYEGLVVVGWPAALANMPMTAIQPAACSVVGLCAIQAVSRVPSLARFRNFDE